MQSLQVSSASTAKEITPQCLCLVPVNNKTEENMDLVFSSDCGSPMSKFKLDPGKQINVFYLEKSFLSSNWGYCTDPNVVYKGVVDMQKMKDLQALCNLNIV